MRSGAALLYQRYSPVLPAPVASFTKASREFHASLVALCSWIGVTKW